MELESAGRESKWEIPTDKTFCVGRLRQERHDPSRRPWLDRYGRTRACTDPIVESLVSLFAQPIADVAEDAAQDPCSTRYRKSTPRKRQRSSKSGNASPTRRCARARSRERSERRSFLAALEAAQGGAIVAEIKRASPSSGLIARSFDPAAIARAYDAAGCDAISVITERDHFLGELSYLDEVRAVTSRPLLRKDFIWTRYQVAQSAAYGADCVLLIVGGMDDAGLQKAMAEAQGYDLDVLAEAHDDVELRRAIDCGGQADRHQQPESAHP